jgi:hypothetical protein
MSYRRHIFEVGHRYRVKRSLMSGASTFIKDEVVVFRLDGYSPYDNSFVYEFRSETTGEVKAWWLHKQQSSDGWKDIFEPTP